MGKGARGRGGANIPRKRPGRRGKNGDAAKQTKLETLVIKVPFPNEKAAGIAYKSVMTEEGPKSLPGISNSTTDGNSTSRVFACEGSFLVCTLKAPGTKALRTACKAFFELLAIIETTMAAMQLETDTQIKQIKAAAAAKETPPAKKPKTDTAKTAPANGL